MLWASPAGLIALHSFGSAPLKHSQVFTVRAGALSSRAMFIPAAPAPRFLRIVAEQAAGYEGIRR
jgi:hypothetical protein